MAETRFSYSGKDNLEAMRLATRYNAFLVGLIERHARPNDRILDFGAGLGLFAQALRERGHRVSCLEADADLKNRLAEHDFHAVRLPSELADDSIDYLYSLNVLEHIDDDVAALSALIPKLKTGARLLIYVPAFPVLFSAMDRLVGHHRRYTAGSLRGLLEKVGLHVERIEYADSLGFPASLAYRILGGSGVLEASSVVTYDRWIFPLSRKIDRVTRRLVGKNVFAIARKP